MRNVADVGRDIAVCVADLECGDAEIAGAVAGIFARLCIRGKLLADVACGVGREGAEVAAGQ